MHPLLEHLGARVRRAREARGDSRTALAERAGMSLRFLAQLEAGDANVSVLRLQEVAAALEMPMADLLGPAPAHPAATSAERIQSLLLGRTPADLQEICDWMSARFATMSSRRVALLGLRGAGKSSIGEPLARKLGVPFFELDAMIEAAAGLPLQQIFELQGAAAYRQRERATLSRFLATTPEGVLATGGGIVTEPETYAMLRRGCVTVWLRARPEEHWDRVVRQGDRRPMDGHPSAMQELRSLWQARRPLYALAQHVVDTSQRRVDAVVGDVAARLQTPARRSTP